VEVDHEGEVYFLAPAPPAEIEAELGARQRQR
jgi:hypothetical protein